MPWVYRTLFEASGLDPDKYLKLKRLDPAFRIVLSDGRTLDIPAESAGLRDAFAAIDPADGPNLDKFLDQDGQVRQADRPFLLRPAAGDLGPGDAQLP